MLRFGPYLLDPASRQLWHDGAPVVLRDAALALLLTLAQRPGEVVSKRTLCEVAWPTLDDAENNLHVEISALRKRLGAAWVVTVPGRGYQFAGTPQAVAGPDDARPLVGRAEEAAALRAALHPGRLVTLTGEAGIGKTRLARALAAAADAGQATWIDVAAVATGAAGAALLDQARTAGLVVLDGCDAAPAEAARLAATLLDMAPAAPLVATSRERLRVPGEQLLRLAGLAVQPDPGGAADAPAPASRLWAQVLDGAVAAGERQAAEPAHVDALCRHVDGHPLAIEAAARWCAQQPDGPATALRRLLAHPLPRWLDLLDGAPLAAAPIDRRPALRRRLAPQLAGLGPAEHELLRRLAAAGEPLVADDLAATLPDPWEAIEALGRLADRSLVRPLDGSGAAAAPRYDVSPLVRALLAPAPPR